MDAGGVREGNRGMAYEYVKQHYGVPAEPGTRVSMKGRRPTETGVIVRKRCYDHYVHVRFDGQRFDVPVHPLDLEYNPSAQPEQERTRARP